MKVKGAAQAMIATVGVTMSAYVHVGTVNELYACDCRVYDMKSLARRDVTVTTVTCKRYMCVCVYIYMLLHHTCICVFFSKYSVSLY